MKPKCETTVSFVGNWNNILCPLYYITHKHKYIVTYGLL
jgi:ABC-type glycerol-3-phosphate transport system permease component